MQFDVDSGAVNIINKIESAGFDAYIAGGAVRDLIMGKHPHDYDIATGALPSQIKSIFKRTVDTGIKHGTVTVIENRIGYEITTFRSDGEYRDGRHPENVKFITDITEDLARRDFTINAMAYNPKSGLFDFYGGTDDIKNKIIRCVGEPERRFEEDALRMLRAVRFSAVLGFGIENATKNAIVKCAPLIRKVSSERIRDELNKILLSDNPERIVILHELGLMKHILPELERCFGEKQRNKYHIYDVGTHIMKALEFVPKDLAVCWAVLLHDIGKPNCSSVDANGIIHFYGHHKESRKIAVDILHRLRFDNDFIQSVSVLVENHDVRIDSQYPPVKRMMAKVGEELFEKLLMIQTADNSAKNPKYVGEKISRIENVRTIYQNVLAEHQPYMISSLAVTGKDLLKIGFKPGREIGDTLRTLLDDVIITPEFNTKEYLLKKAKTLKKKRSVSR